MPPKFVRNPQGSDYATARSAETRALLETGSDEEDFFLKGPDPKINSLQNQVNEVVGVMQNNVSKVLDRGDKLEDLQDKSDSLAGSSDMFRSRARGLHKKMWWKNCKMKIVVALIILIIILVIIIPIIVKNQGNN